MLILDGKALAAKRKLLIQDRVQQFRQQWGRVPCLQVLLVGQDPASRVYVRNKIKTCQELGLRSELLQLPQMTPTELRAHLQDFNQNDELDGVLVQLPLPQGLDPSIVFSDLSVEKDVDGLTYLSAGLLQAKKAPVASCTPQGIMTLLAHYQIPLAGKKVVIIGRSPIVGLPLFQLMLQAQASVTVCHSRTPDVREFTRAADVVVVAAGKPHLLGKDDFREQAVVVDVGIHGSGSGGPLRGDVRPQDLEKHLFAMTPVPGGVGPMTIVTLMENLLTLADWRRRGGFRAS